jgi:hypothetical protein
MNRRFHKIPCGAPPSPHIRPFRADGSVTITASYELETKK